VLLTLPIREVMPATARARIVRIGLEGAAFPYEPGQAVFVGPAGETPRRPYSIAISPETARREDRLELLVGASTSAPDAPERLRVGTLVDVEGPVGRFTFPAVPTERRFVFIAGGTGIAPLRAMLQRALGGAARPRRRALQRAHAVRVCI
jgi:ferredoxin-NADP reductase